MEFAFLVSAYTGQPLLLDPEMLAHQSPDNIYGLQWLPLADLNGSPCYPGPLVPEVLEIVTGEQ
jgi:hypothetical protein